MNIYPLYNPQNKKKSRSYRTWCLKEGTVKIVTTRHSRYLYVVVTNFYSDGRIDRSGEMPLVDALKEAELMVSLLKEDT